MQNFQLIDNNFIKSVEALAITKREEPRPLTNSLKTLVKTFSYQQEGLNNVYGQRKSIKIPRDYNFLSQIFVKFTLSTGAVASDVDSYFATKIMKYIRLTTSTGNVLQTITPRYSQARIDQMYGNPNWSWMSLCIEPDATFASGEVTCILPLSLFFSEDPNCFLNTRQLEQLELEFVTNDGRGYMGMSQNLISIGVEVFSTYHNTYETSRNDDFTYTIKGGMMPKTLYGSYNMYEEDNQTCLAGTTSKTFLLNCPNPVFTLNLALVDSNSNRAEIKTLKLKVGNDEFLNIDYRMNFQIYGRQSGYLENGTFTYFFDKEKSRTTPSGLITFSKAFYPCYATIEFDALPGNYTLYTFEEYRTRYDVKDDGTIKLSTDTVMKLPTEGQDFTNIPTSSQTFQY